MSAIVSLSRPGLCAGRLPLQLLISKLLRFGEHTAAASLQSLPLAYQRRVRWTLCGTSLTIEADGSRAACGALNEHGFFPAVASGQRRWRNAQGTPLHSPCP